LAQLTGESTKQVVGRPRRSKPKKSRYIKKLDGCMHSLAKKFEQSGVRGEVLFADCKIGSMLLCAGSEIDNGDKKSGLSLLRKHQTALFWFIPLNIEDGWSLLIVCQSPAKTGVAKYARLAFWGPKERGELMLQIVDAALHSLFAQLNMLYRGTQCEWMQPTQMRTEIGVTKRFADCMEMLMRSKTLPFDTILKQRRAKKPGMQ